jgi:phosphopantothenoylcysteine decarboxylase/phosphopantothenate--cysteine ligase
LGQSKQKNQVLVGFALESSDELNYAREKLRQKNLDFVVMNSLREKGAGFGHDTNKVVVLSSDGKQETTELLTKEEIAKEIWKIILA